MLQNYESRLRVIGDQIEAQGLRDIAIFEIEGGFILRAAQGAYEPAGAFEFPDEHFPTLMEGAHGSRGSRNGRAYRPAVLPTGYEDFLRAIGGELDGMNARSVTICELEHSFLVTGLQPVEASDGRITFQKFERTLDERAIQVVLDEAFKRRSNNGFFSRRLRLKPLGG